MLGVKGSTDVFENVCNLSPNNNNNNNNNIHHADTEKLHMQGQEPLPTSKKAIGGKCLPTRQANPERSTSVFMGRLARLIPPGILLRRRTSRLYAGSNGGGGKGGVIEKAKYQQLRTTRLNPQRGHKRNVLHESSLIKTREVR